MRKLALVSLLAFAGCFDPVLAATGKIAVRWEPTEHPALIGYELTIGKKAMLVPAWTLAAEPPAVCRLNGYDVSVRALGRDREPGPWAILRDQHPTGCGTCGPVRLRFCRLKGGCKTGPCAGRE